MSIDINWDSLTTGPDGQHLSEAIRDFIHDKFQEVPFPRFIQSVNVVSFDLGTVAPELEIKDICEPYPEFYEDAYADGSDEEEEESEDEEEEKRRKDRERRRKERRDRERNGGHDYEEGHGNQYDGQPGSGSGGAGGGSGAPMSPPGYFESRYPGFRPAAFSSAVDQLTSPPQLRRTGTNLHYFHSSLSSGFSGALTPLASFQPATHASSTPRNIPVYHHEDYSPSGSPPSSLSGNRSPSPMPPPPLSRMKSTDSSGAMDDGTREPPPTPFEPGNVVVGGPSTPPQQVDQLADSLASLRSADGDGGMLPPPRLRLREPRDTDVQIVARVRYAGDVRMEITCALLIDYPAPMFVSLPVRVTVTGITFDGTAVVAYIRRRAHFCFVDDGDEPGVGVGRMLREIKIESEIGEKGRGKQVLKNVGKVERFVLERVRRILEEEFIFPSSWTFLL